MSSSIDLAGTWDIHHDPLSQGTTGAWQVNPPRDGWVKIEVPSAWQSVLGIEARGLAWYRKELPHSAAEWAMAGDRVRLRFESVATDCWVFVNGVDVGRHVGDYLPFEFDITDAVLKSKRPLHITVRVDQLHALRPAKGVVTENGHITKGFHDVLSAQHAGIWGGVTVRRTGPVTIAPSGLWIDADPATNVVTIHAELTGLSHRTTAVCAIRDAQGEQHHKVDASIKDGILTAEFRSEKPLNRWSPKHPNLYETEIVIADGDAALSTTERVTRKFGVRSITTGGPDNSQILLNDVPLQIRGVLHWGHEPRHIAPMPSPEQVRAEFKEILARGFNCMCLCMFYPPEYYFDIADEMGILIWQEHPVWKSRMTPDCMLEYRRCYEGFLRRDRQHPSVIIVSGTCEHDTFDQELGRWWWDTSAKMLPRTLRQIQTGFLEWTPPGQTDLYDDHVYDNCGRWVKFHEDMQARIGKLPPKPFIMGETIISNAWPDVDAMKALGNPWWLTHGINECGDYERSITRRINAETLTRFKRQGQSFGVAHRKFQAEVLRTHPRNAGFVTNSIRDVPICRIGLMDDVDNWRFTPQDLAPWLGDVVLLLRTPGHLRGFRGGQTVECEIGISNYLDSPIDADCVVKVADQSVTVRLVAKPGEVAWTRVPVKLEKVDQPNLVSVTATCGDLSNSWSLVALPDSKVAASAVVCNAPGFTDKELEPSFEESSYSSGWGLPCATWRPVRQSPSLLLPGVPAAMTFKDNAVVITHRLTPEIDRFLHSGGRVILLAGSHAGGIDSKWINLWGVLPLVVEHNSPHAAIRRGESDAILAILLHDLTANTTRALPTDDLSLGDHLDPILRLAWTHDSGTPRSFDLVASARVGNGLLLISTLDHSTKAGLWLLHRLTHHAAEIVQKEPERELDLSRFLAT